MDAERAPSTDYPEADLEAAAKALAVVLGHRFVPGPVLGAALTHKSIKGAANNERLEHLGDAVLETALTDVLFAIRPPLSEGQMGAIRGNLVHNQSLAASGKRLGLLHYARIAPSVPEVVREGKLLADLVEALMGAIYLEGGIAAVKPVCEQIFAKELALARRDPRVAGRPSAKTRLQALVQRRQFPAPTYTVIQFHDHPARPYFRVRADIAGRYVSDGEGHTRLAAEEQAAGALIALL